MMLPADVLAAAPFTLTVLVAIILLLAYRVIARVSALPLPRQVTLALDGITVGLMVLFAVLVLVRFLTLA
jgi:hypothetical protein